MADPTPDPTPQALAYDFYKPPQATVGPLSQGKVPEPVPDAVRHTYASALYNGETLGPQDFHDTYHGAGHPPLPDLHTQLPDNANLTDHAIQLAHQSGLPPTPEVVDNAKRNLLNHWASTGQDPSVTVQQATPDVASTMTSTPAEPETAHPLRELIHHLEGSSDTAVSPAGAVGRNQVMPATAKQYGFDPAKLADPAYNQMVSDAIQADLMHRYHGDTQAVLIAYNAGPGVADAWLQSGRDNSVLPNETQKYLARAGNLPNLWKPVDAVFDPMGTLGAEKESPIGANIGEALTALGIPGIEDQVKEYQTKLAEMDKAGVPLAERMTYEAQNSPFANAFGVGSIEGDAAKASIRAATGLSRRALAAATAALEPMRATINKGLPEFEGWLAKGPGVLTPMWPAPDIMNLIDHVENATKYGGVGQGGSKLSPNSPMAPIAGALRMLYQTTRQAIENEIPDMSSFYEDYYRHMWTDPQQADRVHLPGRLGSSASLNLRSIPTITEGIMKGLKPRILDPIENTLHYVGAMRNFLAQHHVFEQGRTDGYIAYAMGGRAPHPGWIPLKGRFAEKAVPMSNGGAAIMRAYAPPGFASAYNSWVGKGIYEWPKAGAIYDKLQFVSNMMVGMKLAFSGYHAWNIVQETAIGGLANAIGEVAHGEVQRGLTDMGMSVTVLPKLTKAYLTGRKLQQQYLLQKNHSAEMQQLANLFTEAGGRAVGRGQEYSVGQAANWFQAWRRGSLAQELKSGAARTIGDASESGIKRGALLLPRVGAYFGHEIGRTISTLSSPLFDHLIPKIKMAAWADEMSTWVRNNPLASHEATMVTARKLLDSMDDRFGEMVQDNLFWNRGLKQGLNLSTVSVGWEYGTLRAFGGAAKDILTGNVLSTRARWLMAFPIMMGLSSAVYQYLKTGTLPSQTETPVRDLIAPRTGGQTPYGKPERALLPGYEKDPIQWYNQLSQAPDILGVPQALGKIAETKLNPMMQTAKGVVLGTDWKGDPIRSQVPQNGEIPPGWKDYADFVLDQMTPIVADQPRKRRHNDHASREADGQPAGTRHRGGPRRGSSGAGSGAAV